VLPAGSLDRLSAVRRDLLAVQEEASQIVAHAVGARPRERVLDLCAAPGGKTAVMAADMGGEGVLVASDFRAGRVALLESTLRRAQVDVALVALDATRPLPFGAVFDRVLVDAPCSGLGILRRDPDLKWSRRPEDLAALADAQGAMLTHAARAVRPGGRLIYATCSSEPEENDDVVARFLGAHAGFTLGRTDPGPSVDYAERLIDERGFLRTLPHLHGLDAFFAATLQRQG
jgi:16S rRNA (cytosine967-C5)-methyltransferase